MKWNLTVSHHLYSGIFQLRSIDSRSWGWKATNGSDVTDSLRLSQQRICHIERVKSVEVEEEVEEEEEEGSAASERSLPALSLIIWLPFWPGPCPFPLDRSVHWYSTRDAREPNRTEPSSKEPRFWILDSGFNVRCARLGTKKRYLKSDCDKLKINEVKIDGTDRKMRQANKIFWHLELSS